MAKTFSFNNNYFIDKPVNKRKVSCEKWWLFEVKERNGNEIVFNSREKNDRNDYKGKILICPKSGDEVSCIAIDGTPYLIEAKNCYSKGRRLNELGKEEKETLLRTPVEAEWSENKGDFVKTSECGITLKEFCKKK